MFSKISLVPSLKGLKTRLAIALAVLAVGVGAAGTTASPAEAATSCRTYVWATLDYLSCVSGNFAAGYGPTGYFWLETTTYTRSFSLQPWVFVSRMFEWRWVYSNGSSVRVSCTLYDAWNQARPCGS